MHDVALACLLAYLASLAAGLTLWAFQWLMARRLANKPAPQRLMAAQPNKKKDKMAFGYPGMGKCRYAIDGGEAC
jgi:hypothetical protein